jgi:LmbE family N-acetylglucosaminyl deacetylase
MPVARSTSRLLSLFVFALSIASSAFGQADRPLRIIAFGAHPDDCEIKASGVAAMWAAMGHQVKFVSVTNGDIGHHEMAGGILARRRTAEVERCGELLGIAETVVLDNHDGELMPTLENRKTIARLIRDWQADIVLTPRSNDYHPDHRYTAILVQDAAFMVTVPNFTPDTPRIERNPVFLYYYDRFQKPYPFEPDIAVGIDAVGDRKWECMAALRSQFSEWNAWLDGYLDQVPQDEPGRKAFIGKLFQDRDAALADRYRDLLVGYYGAERGRSFRYAEVFEVSEYGGQPTREELRRLFPFFE